MTASPPQKGHIPFLDHLRGVAILTVFLCHLALPCLVFTAHNDWNHNDGCWDLYLSDPWERFATTFFLQGWIGVPIFFVISGFCIHLSFERSRMKSWLDFYLRRFFRIYPPYLVALLFFALLLPYSRLHFGTTHHEGGMTGRSIRDLFTDIFLVHTFPSTNDINPPFWSVAAEVKLYLIYPLLLWLAGRMGWLGTIGITAAIELGMRSGQVLHNLQVLPFDTTFYTQWPFYFWFSWAIGAWIADCHLKNKPLPFLKVGFYPLVALFVVVDFIRPIFPYAFTIASLCTARVMAKLLHAPRLPQRDGAGWRSFLSEHLAEVGIVSYSIYLIHYPLQDTLYLLVQRGAPRLFNHSLGSVVFMLAWLPLFWVLIFYWSKTFHRLFEKTSIALGNRLIRMRRGDPSTVKTEP